MNLQDSCSVQIEKSVLEQTLETPAFLQAKNGPSALTELTNTGKYSPKSVAAKEYE